ncbi:hypothetical protein KA012_02100 [Candidatus Woesebacteria bacterium]|nr:hypothetical protein [Candidatus Woesebacteria bacterium]
MSTPSNLDTTSSSFIAPVTGDQIEKIEVQSAMPKEKGGKLNQKSIRLFGIVVLVGLLILGGVSLYLNFQKKSAAVAPTPEPAKRRVVEPTNIIPVAERPVVYVMPEADGRNLTLEVVSVKKPATSVEYELEYQAGELLQGVNGALDLASLPAKTTQLMGSCSAGGKCSYHENVKGGSLLLKFIAAENYSLKQDWKYIDNKAKETAFSSKDAKFQLESKDLATTRYLVIYNSPGYPEGLSGTVVSDPYTIQTSSPLKGAASLTMRATEEGNLVIMGFDGSKWTEFKGALDGKMITADVTLLPLYVVVMK